MTETEDFVEKSIEMIEVWHGIKPPNAAAREMLADLYKSVAAFKSLRGTLRFEDEPSSFEAALLETSKIEVRS